MRNLKRMPAEAPVQPATDHWGAVAPRAVLRFGNGGASLGVLRWTSDGVPYKTQTGSHTVRRAGRT